MNIKTISNRKIHEQSLSNFMESLVGKKDMENFLSPQQRADGRYVTSESTLNKKIDPRIFLETQVKRICRWLTAKPPVVNKFFDWLFVKKMKMKLDYFSEGEQSNLNLIYKTDEKIEKNVTSDFKIQNLGHATQLIQTEGINILTDPVFGNLSPIVYPAMTKKFKQDIQIKDLQKIDVILISHNHRDHVDEDSLKAMIKNGKQPRLFVPKGDKTYFEKLGFKKVCEFAWHEEAAIGSELANEKISICSVPADHRSGRYGYDTHKSLVSGWVISPKSRDEILYFAGDTARLDNTRILSLALNIYALYQDKKDLAEKEMLPKIINMVPGGPNYTRRDMKPTHQSAVDSIISAFRLALALKEISQKDGHIVPAADWLAATATVFIHHNRFELGPDRFNENVFVYNRLLSYLEMDDRMLVAHKSKQQRKSASWSLFSHRKDFIIDGIEELKNLAVKIWPNSSGEERIHKIKQFINPRTHFPLINEKLTSTHLFRFSDNENSTIKPNTEKGRKKMCHRPML